MTDGDGTSIEGMERAPGADSDTPGLSEVGRRTVLRATIAGLGVGCGVAGGSERSRAAPSSDDVTPAEPGPSAPAVRSEWSQRAKLVADDGDDSDEFGESVAVSGEGTTALIGAEGDEDPNGDEAGSAYVFSGGESTPRSPTASFTTTVPAIDTDRFTLPEAGEAISFDAASAGDPDASIASYGWDFDANGTVDAGGVRTTHTYTTVGDTSPTLEVTDTDGLTDIASQTLTIGLPGRRRTRRLGDQIDTASVHSDIETVLDQQLDGALELNTGTLDALREAVVDGRVDRTVAENAITRLQSVEEVSRDLLRRLGPSGTTFFARQLVRKAVEAAVALVVVAISLKVAAAAGGTLVTVVVGGTVSALLDTASFLLGDWLAPDSEGNDGYRQQAERDLRDSAGDIIDDIETGVLSGAQAIADRIEALVDTLVETAADGLRAVIELNIGDRLAESTLAPGARLLGTGAALYSSLDDLNSAYDPTALETGLQGTTQAATDAVATGRSQIFGTINTTSTFIETLSGLSTDFTNLSETIEDFHNDDISAWTLVELAGTLLDTVSGGLATAATATVGAAVGPPLVSFIKTVHSEIVQSAIQGQNVGFTSL